MPDENGNPQEGEDGYVAYLESLQKNTVENQQQSPPDDTVAEQPTPPTEENPSIEESPPFEEEDTISGNPVVLGNAGEPFTNHAETIEGPHTGHNPFYNGSPDVNPDNPNAEMSDKDWGEDVNQENR